MKLHLKLEEVRQPQRAEALRQGCSSARTRRQGVQNQPRPLLSPKQAYAQIKLD